MLLIPIYLCFFYENLEKQPHFHEKLLNTLDTSLEDSINEGDLLSSLADHSLK